MASRYNLFACTGLYFSMDKCSNQVDLFPKRVKARKAMKAACMQTHKDSKVKLEAYELALAKRNAAVTERAYESGVRAAMQMIAAGLSRRRMAGQVRRDIQEWEFCALTPEQRQAEQERPEKNREHWKETIERIKRERGE